MKPEHLVLIGTLGGSAIGAISSVIAIWVTKAYEEKTLRRQLLINAGIEQWKKAFDLVNQTGGAAPPIEDFIIHLLALSELMAARMTPKTAVERLKKVQETTDAILAWRTEELKLAQDRHNV